MNRLEIAEAAQAVEDDGTRWQDRIAHLLPTRYFHFYLFRERETGDTCWLPEGFTQ